MATLLGGYTVKVNKYVTERNTMSGLVGEEYHEWPSRGIP